MIQQNIDLNPIGGIESMQLIKKDGVTLAYQDINPGSPPMLFVHGWGCDHTVFAPQVEFFRRSHRVVSIDLRGHGESDAPDQDYTMAAFADDLAWLCTELALTKPIVVGHSMGGNVALELAARYPEIPVSIVLIDSLILPRQSILDALRSMVEALRGPDYQAAYRQTVLSLCLPTDDETRKRELFALSPRAPQHVVASAFKNHVTDYDATPAAAGCHVPIAYIGSLIGSYIGAAIPMTDLIQFRSLTPHLLTAQTLGSGHFSPLFVPDQVNAMLSTFAQRYSPASKDGRLASPPGSLSLP
jgi:pimeloyl-ACP methyl ester carboxylesterase